MIAFCNYQLSSIIYPLTFFITFPASWLIYVFCTQHYLVIVGYFTVAITCNIAATHANCMKLGNIICFCQQVWYLTEGIAKIIHIKPRDDHPDATKSKLITNIGDLRIKELSFINPDYIYTLTE